VLCEINRQRADISRNVTDGIDEDTLDSMIEALIRMKTTMTHDSHAPRRAAYLPETREAV
jgi:hypothetical protein